MARIFGAISGVALGTSYPDRRAVAAAGIHKPLQAGISGGATEGADSIVVSGGYEDDEDYGSVIVYTGHGGQDSVTKQQTADQTLTGGNLALAINVDEGLPLRVVRGSGGEPAYSPSTGYRYDGLFTVESAWQATGTSGFKVWRFRLKAVSTASPVLVPVPAPAAGLGGSAYVVTQRTVRSTAVTQWVKALHDHRCQVCGLRMVTGSGPYAEGAHLRPLGNPHHGPDSADNVLCLCPNDHVLLDRGAIAVDGEWNVVDLTNGSVLGPLRVDAAHGLGASHAAYHRNLFC